MNSREKIGFLHMFIGLLGGYMSLMVGEVLGLMSLIVATGNVLYACSLLLGGDVAD
jgi:hypothetical protein